jgi:cytoskeleton protein RodZ
MMKNQETVTQETKLKPGTLLKQKREALGLSQKQICDRLRLRITLIQSIEDNNFDIDKVATFVRGYVRSYAKAVGISDAEILAAYDYHYGPVSHDTEMKSFSKKTIRDQHNSRINFISFAVLVIIVGISSIWWLQSQQLDTLSPSNTLLSLSSESSAPEGEDEDLRGNSGFATVSDLETQEASSGTSSSDAGANNATIDTHAGTADVDLNEVQPESVTTPVSVDDSATPISDSGSVTTPVTTQSSVVSQPLSSVVSQPSSSVAESVVGNTDNVVTMTFSNDCWIRVKDSTGKILSIGLKKTGQTISMEGQRPYNITLGAPESVTMTLASEPFDLSGYTSGKVARFTLP